MNISRHAAARNVFIQLLSDERNVQIHVMDDGVGFDMLDVENEPSSMRGLGLLGMRERLELIGGELEISSEPGSGTSLHIHVPLQVGRYVHA